RSTTLFRRSQVVGQPAMTSVARHSMEQEQVTQRTSKAMNFFDQNLSYRLVKALASEFPDSAHVRGVGLEKGLDGLVWEYAKVNGFVIVSKGSHFHQRSFVDGHPRPVRPLRPLRRLLIKAFRLRSVSLCAS